MDSNSVYTMKPIGFMKSVFHFKNGTPRQSALCENARGILTIEKTIFNNPEHSLDGLQQFSHAWIQFIFHKNNNAHKKAKVKPPRLNGQRVGVFSTRSPYRVNNIGLSLVKIDKIEGASVHFSGIDILDGTPVIDIKPYIPEYDTPSNISMSVNMEDGTDVSCLSKQDKVEEKELIPTLLHSNSNTHQNHITQVDNDIVQSDPSSLNKLCSAQGHDIRNSESIETGFYSLSNDLDTASLTLHQSSVKNDSEPGVSMASNSFLSQDDINSENIDKREEKVEELNEDDILNDLVGDVINRAASDVLLGKTLIDESNSVFEHHSVNSAKFTKNECDSTLCVPLKEVENESGETTVKLNVSKNISNSAVTAPWLTTPPVNKVRVIFSSDSLNQLEQFHCKSVDRRYKTEMLTGPQDAKSAISSILHQEPRSVYRRQKCQDCVYFFALDVLHVTCWFDGNDAVTVLRVKPSADVPQISGVGNVDNADHVHKLREWNET